MCHFLVWSSIYFNGTSICVITTRGNPKQRTKKWFRFAVCEKNLYCLAWKKSSDFLIMTWSHFEFNLYCTQTFFHNFFILVRMNIKIILEAIIKRYWLKPSYAKRLVNLWKVSLWTNRVAQLCESWLFDLIITVIGWPHIRISFGHLVNSPGNILFIANMHLSNL